MENYKVKVNGNIEELISLFASLGCKYFNHTVTEKNYILAEDGKVFFCKLKSNFKKSACQEVTVDQLRDLVVLKRNDSKDANVYQDGDVPCWYDLYLTSDKNLYFFSYGEGWKLSNLNDDKYYSKLLKPITKEPAMKEFLNPIQNYKLVTCKVGETPIPKDWIEVPEGAMFATGDDVVFRKNNYIFNGGRWKETNVTVNNAEFFGLSFVWQRETLNDKVKTAEVARQSGGFEVANVEQTLSCRESTYGSFKDVAELTSDLMSDLLRLDMSFVQREALHMICSKLARIANGNPNHVDSWHDIAGYATLVVKDINDQKAK